MNPPDIEQIFGPRVALPDGEAMRRLARLVGRDDAISRLSKLLGVLMRPTRLDEWLSKHHPDASAVLAHVKGRLPFVILAGDVGTGKTELAETIGDKVARQEKVEITLYPMSLSVRGGGLVGEMTRLISGAFSHVKEAAKKTTRKKDGAFSAGALLLIDEADAMTQSRESAQMHHEDRAGVNALIRGLDSIHQANIPVAVIMCTNRLDAIDPAVRRRAADVFNFGRPNEAQRHAILAPALGELGFDEKQICRLAAVVGGEDSNNQFTFSDLTQRFMHALVMDAYPDKPVTFERAESILKSMRPTPRFTEQQ